MDDIRNYDFDGDDNNEINADDVIDESNQQQIVTQDREIIEISDETENGTNDDNDEEEDFFSEIMSISRDLNKEQNPFLYEFIEKRGKYSPPYDYPLRNDDSGKTSAMRSNCSPLYKLHAAKLVLANIGCPTSKLLTRFFVIGNDDISNMIYKTIIETSISEQINYFESVKSEAIEKQRNLESSDAIISSDEKDWKFYVDISLLVFPYDPTKTRNFYFGRQSESSETSLIHLPWTSLMLKFIINSSPVSFKMHVIVDQGTLESNRLFDKRHEIMFTKTKVIEYLFKKIVLIGDSTLFLYLKERLSSSMVIKDLLHYFLWNSTPQREEKTTSKAMLRILIKNRAQFAGFNDNQLYKQICNDRDIELLRILIREGFKFDDLVPGYDTNFGTMFSYFYTPSAKQEPRKMGWPHWWNALILLCESGIIKKNIEEYINKIEGGDSYNSLIMSFLGKCLKKAKFAFFKLLIRQMPQSFFENTKYILNSIIFNIVSFHDYHSGQFGGDTILVIDPLFIDNYDKKILSDLKVTEYARDLFISTFEYLVEKGVNIADQHVLVIARQWNEIYVLLFYPKDNDQEADGAFDCINRLFKETKGRGSIDYFSCFKNIIYSRSRMIFLRPKNKNFLHEFVKRMTFNERDRRFVDPDNLSYLQVVIQCLEMYHDVWENNQPNCWYYVFLTILDAKYGSYDDIRSILVATLSKHKGEEYNAYLWQSYIDCLDQFENIHKSNPGGWYYSKNAKASKDHFGLYMMAVKPFQSALDFKSIQCRGMYTEKQMITLGFAEGLLTSRKRKTKDLFQEAESDGEEEDDIQDLQKLTNVGKIISRKKQRTK